MSELSHQFFSSEFLFKKSLQWIQFEKIIRTFKTGGVGGIRKSNTGSDKIKVHCMYIWKYHNEVLTLYNSYMLMIFLKRNLFLFQSYKGIVYIFFINSILLDAHLIESLLDIWLTTGLEQHIRTKNKCSSILMWSYIMVNSQ
jgi:hypothetical protein